MQVVCMFMKKISIYLKINNISVMIDIKEELNKLLSELNNSAKESKYISLWEYSTKRASVYESIVDRGSFLYV